MTEEQIVEELIPEERIANKIKEFAMENKFSNIANAYFTNNNSEFKILAFDFFLTDEITIDYQFYSIESKEFATKTRFICYSYQGDKIDFPINEIYKNKSDEIKIAISKIDNSKIFESYCNLIKVFLINKIPNIRYN